MPEPKPRRSIFDTLKKSADGRLGLAEAARVADKISVFPKKRIDPTVNPIHEPTDDPTQTPKSDPTHDLTQQSDHGPTHEPTRVPTGVGSTVPPHDPSYNPTHDLTKKNDPTNEPTNDPTIKKIIRGLSENKRRFLHFLIDNEPLGDDYIISRRAIAKALQLTEISVKRYFSEFAELGFFHKETYRQGICQGVRVFLVRSQCQAFKRNDSTYDPTIDLTPKYDSTIDPTAAPTNDPTVINVERQIENLSVSLNTERIVMTWPNLAGAGFGTDQLAQIGQALAELGKPTEKVFSSLDHAEWEIEHGQMKDKDGQPVADPCSWVFRSLARTGYYRRPKGYVSPEQQAAQDAEEEARAVIAARQKAEQAQFEAWRDGLSPDEMANAMRGHPGGPKDAWLKAVWKKEKAVS